MAIPKPKFSFQRHYSEGQGDRLIWSLSGPSGGVHIWAQFARDGEAFCGVDRCYGGIEVHHKKKPYDHAPEYAPVKNCWLTGCDCWPEGSSLYFEEMLQPMIEGVVSQGESPEIISSFMEGEMLDWYRQYLSRGDFKEDDK